MGEKQKKAANFIPVFHKNISEKNSYVRIKLYLCSKNNTFLAKI